MTTLREAATRALEALESDPVPLNAINNACAVLRAALAEPVQEPVGYLWPTGRHPEFRFTQQERDGVSGTPVYLSPPQRPAEPVQEPVAYKDKYYESLHHQDFGNSIPLYAAPPQRLPLSDEEIFSIWRKHTNLDAVRHLPYEDAGLSFARAIEQAHGIKERT